MYTQIEENIYTIPVPLPDNPLRNLNSYVIVGKERSLLIDTGFRMPECRAALTEGLRDLGVDMANTDIYLTHLHADHSGLAADLAAPDTRVFISNRDLVILGNVGRNEASKLMYRKAGFSETELDSLLESPAWRNSTRKTEQFVGLEDGDILEYGGRRLEVVLTPGHTPGHACLYDAENKIMFLGDHVLFDITPNITSWPGYEDSLGTYIRSLMKIYFYDVRIPLPAHRSIKNTMRGRAEEIIESHGARILEILNALDAEPGMTTYELAGHITWRVHGDVPGWEGFPLAQKWFAVGETLAHLEYLLPRDRVRREEVNGVWHWYT